MDIKMHIFHKWSKWSEIKEENWQQIMVYGIYLNEPIRYIRHYQERYCLICGKYEKKYID